MGKVDFERRMKIKAKFRKDKKAKKAKKDKENQGKKK